MQSNLKTNPSYSLPYTIRVEWTTYMVFSLFFIPISALFIFVNMKSPFLSPWAGFGFPLVFLSVFLIWAQSFTIVLKEDRIIYKLLHFAVHREVKYCDISKLKIDVGLGPASLKHHAYYRLFFVDKSGKEILVINLKPFSRRDLALLVDIVSRKNKEVEMDELSMKIKEGGISSIAAEGARNIWQIASLIFWVFLLSSLMRIFLFRK